MPTPNTDDLLTVLDGYDVRLDQLGGLVAGTVDPATPDEVLIVGALRQGFAAHDLTVAAAVVTIRHH